MRSIVPFLQLIVLLLVGSVIFAVYSPGSRAPVELNLPGMWSFFEITVAE
jgi:hypothetical protein